MIDNYKLIPSLPRALFARSGQRMDALTQLHQIEWRWVTGHAGDPGNEKADEWANRGVSSSGRGGRKAGGLC